MSAGKKLPVRSSKRPGRAGSESHQLPVQPQSRPEHYAAGKATIRMDFDYDGGGLGKGGTATILVNGEKVASGRIERTEAMIFSADETAGVGVDDATPVTADYKERDNAFTGKILKVTVDVKAIGAAIKAEADAAHAEAAVKKAVSD